MTRQELYNEFIKLAPFENATDDYRDSLSLALHNVSDVFTQLEDNEQPEIWADVLAKMKKVIKKLKLIALNSYKGLPSTAYTQLNYMMDKQIHDDLIWCNIPAQQNFYGMRTFPDRRNGIKFKEMFHIPITKRRVVGTERYSIPGYPCLYVGKSSYVCWEEMGRPLMSSCWCSRLQNIVEISVLDLRIPSEEIFCNNISKYAIVAPLIIASMIPMKGKGSDVFKPEYLIPQLLMEWIIKKNKTGVYYTTTHLTRQTKMDFDYPEDKYDNLAIPIKMPLANGVENCPKLSKIFEITDPANQEIESLKHGNGIAMIDADVDPKVSRYDTSSFGFLEKYLCDDYELHKLN